MAGQRAEVRAATGSTVGADPAPPAETDARSGAPRDLADDGGESE